MARIVHIAIKVDNLEAATRFYEMVYGFTQVSTERNGQHVSRHMTDGYIDLALMIYDSEDAPEAQLAGKGPCIHHIGIEVDDREKYEQKIKAFGGSILSKPGAGALKYRSPDGIIAEIVAEGRYEEKKRAAHARL
ncbi:MAG TPA: VOC family protein [Pseudolabrys sp.]|nr:VOC family protein [Pseudolabrys sp.]